MFPPAAQQEADKLSSQGTMAYWFRIKVVSGPARLSVDVLAALLLFQKLKITTGSDRAALDIYLD
jgi:hypothetical protein